jgi:hypothetical protein
MTMTRTRVFSLSFGDSTVSKVQLSICWSSRGHPTTYQQLTNSVPTIHQDSTTNAPKQYQSSRPPTLCIHIRAYICFVFVLLCITQHIRVRRFHVFLYEPWAREISWVDGRGGHAGGSGGSNETAHRADGKGTQANDAATNNKVNGNGRCDHCKNPCCQFRNLANPSLHLLVCCVFRGLPATHCTNNDQQRTNNALPTNHQKASNAPTAYQQLTNNVPITYSITMLYDPSTRPQTEFLCKPIRRIMEEKSMTRNHEGEIIGKGII